MSVIANLTVALHANSARFVSDLVKSKTTAKNWSKDVAKSFKAITAGTAVATAAITAVAVALKASVDHIDEVTRKAANLSIASHNFRELAYAAKLSGTNMDQVADVIKDITVKIQDAAFSNGGPLVDFFNQIGESALDWSRMAPDEQFKRFINEINKMDSNQARFWLDEINDSAAEMFGTLYGAGSRFNEFAYEAKSAGLAISDSVANGISGARIEFDRFTQIVSSSWEQVVGSIAPSIQTLFEEFNTGILNAAQSVGGFGTIGNALTSVFDTGVHIVAVFQDALYGLNFAVQGVRLGIESLILVFKRAVNEAMVWVNKISGAFFQIASTMVLPILDGLARIDSRAAKLASSIRGSFDQKPIQIFSLENLKQTEDEIARLKKEIQSEADKGAPSKALINRLNELKKQRERQVEIVEKEREQQRLINEAGDKADLVREQLAYEKSVQIRVEQYNKSMLAASGHHERQKEITAKYYRDMERMKSDHDKKTSEINTQIADKKANNPALIAYRKASQGMVQEQQRRIQLMTAGENKALLQEKFSYEDRVRSLVESYQKAYEANAADKEAQKALQLQYYADLQQLAIDNQTVTAELQAEADEKKLEANQGYWEKYLESMQANMISLDDMTKQVIENMASGFGNAFESMIFDSESLGDAFDKMMEGMARTVINSIGQMIGQWLTYQLVQLVVGKTTAAAAAQGKISQAMIGVNQAAINSYAQASALGGPAAGAIASAAAITATMPYAISTTALATTGMAHSGIDEVPREGTWLLDKGERVYTNDSVKKLDQMYGMLASGRGGGDNSQPWVINIYDAPQGTRAEVDEERKVIAIMMKDANSNGQFTSYLSQKLGVKAGGYK